MSGLDRTCCAVAVVILVATSVAKIVSPHDAGMLLPFPVYYVAAAVELLLALSLVSSWRRVGALALLVLAVGGSVVLWVTSGWVGCGCFGAWQLGARYHLAVLAIVGLCAVRLVGARPA